MKAVISEDFYINGTDVQLKQLTPHILYSYPSGNTNAIVLNDNLSNYSCVDLFYRENDGHCGCTRVYNPNEKSVALSVIVPNTYYTRTYIKSSLARLSGTNVSFSNSAECSVMNGGTSWVETPNRIAIIEVIGYK